VNVVADIDSDPVALAREFKRHERLVIIRNAKLTAVVAAVLMLAGSVMDFFVYRANWADFCVIRAISAAIESVLFVGIIRSKRLSVKEVFVTLIPVPPIVAIAWMIYATEGIASPYYAGLNLVLVTIVIALRWSTVKNFMMMGVIFTAYTIAVMNSEYPVPKEAWTVHLVNNYFFLATTGILVACGSFLFERVRKSEFALRKKVEKQNEELECNQMRLQELDETKTRFFSNISHELRTPLTVILGAVDSIREEYTDQTGPEVKQMVDVLRSNGLRLLGLIDNLLDLVRFDQGEIQVNREPVDGTRFMRGLLNGMAPLADRKEINVIWNAENEIPAIELDKDKVEKVVLNLLINAIKFTDFGGSISLSAGYREGSLCFQVSDTGVGMKASRVDQIFSRFWQADTASNRKFRGTGIGLSLVKSLVDLMEGEISVESEEGVGSVFTIAVPAPKASEQPDEEANSVYDPLAEMHREAMISPSAHESQVTSGAEAAIGGREESEYRILVADDEIDLRRFLADELSKRNQVIEARDGIEAYELAKQYEPDLILLDYMMPDKNGMEVCREIRENQRLMHIPIIMLTARADERIKIECLKSGASDFLPKPFALAELKLRVQSQIEMIGFRRNLKEKNTQLNQAMEQLRENEVEMLRHEKLSSLGRMSAGIIHEINNPLNYVKSALHMMGVYSESLAAEDKEDFYDALKDAQEGVSRVVQIVTDLKSFTKGNSHVVEQINLSVVITAAQRFIADQLGDWIKFELKLAEELPILGNENQLIQVFVNLFQNACDAISERRKEEPDLEGEIVVSAAVDPGRDRVMCVVRDNGCGISEENQGKIFDPFYTSKELGEGMGLGLSIVHQIIERHEAEVKIDSIKGQFTQLEFSFPSSSLSGN